MLETTTTDSGPIKNDGTQHTPLDDYVFSNESISQYHWERVPDLDFNGTDLFTKVSWNAYVVNLTSGMWLTEADVGIRTHWWHCFVIIVPDNLKSEYQNHSLIWVTDDNNKHNDGTGMPDENDEYILAASFLSTGVGMVNALLYQVSVVVIFVLVVVALAEFVVIDIQGDY